MSTPERVGISIGDRFDTSVAVRPPLAKTAPFTKRAYAEVMVHVGGGTAVACNPSKSYPNDIIGYGVAATAGRPSGAVGCY